ncbi:MAG: cell wall-binding repeat-containing protein [Euzebya sp.]
MGSLTRRLVGGIAALLLCGALLTGVTDTAWADPPPAADNTHAVALAGGHLSRLVTARGTVLGGGPTDAAWTLLGLQVAGVGQQAGQRIRQGLVDAVTAESVDDMSISQLAVTTLALARVGVDVRAAGTQAVDLVAALHGRQQGAGFDQGLYGPVDPAISVVGHALTMLALAAANEPASQTAIAWLTEQQCPADGGWPTYRDPASRVAGTCEIIPPEMRATSLALQALMAVGAPSPVSSEPFLRSAGDGRGVFGPAPGLDATVLATAQALQAIQALTRSPADNTWAGTAGAPDVLVRAELLGCGWHGRDRGGVPATFRDLDGIAMPPPPVAPGVSESPPTVAAVILALAGALLSQPPSQADWMVGDPFPDCPLTVDRVAGDNRIATAVALSRTAFSQGTDTVVVASARGYADALSGASLAGSLDAPLLLSEPGGAPPLLREEVARLGASEVVLLGGTSALGPAVEQDLAAVQGVQQVRRIAGAGRAETAAMIAAEVGGERAFLVRGFGPDQADPWADALAAGAWSATVGIPVLLTDIDDLPPATAQALEGRSQAIILGGTAVVSDGVANQARAIVGNLVRVAGTNRYDTSRLILQLASTEGVDPRHTFVATGKDFPDSLAAGPAIARLGGSLLLVDPAQKSGGLAAIQAIQGFDYLLDQLTTVAGTAVVPGEVAGDLAVTAREQASG